MGGAAAGGAVTDQSIRVDPEIDVRHDAVPPSGLARSTLHLESPSQTMPREAEGRCRRVDTGASTRRATRTPCHSRDFRHFPSTTEAATIESARF